MRGDHEFQLFQKDRPYESPAGSDDPFSWDAIMTDDAQLSGHQSPAGSPLATMAATGLAPPLAGAGPASQHGHGKRASLTPQTAATSKNGLRVALAGACTHVARMPAHRPTTQSL